MKGSRTVSRAHKPSDFLQRASEDLKKERYGLRFVRVCVCVLKRERQRLIDASSHGISARTQRKLIFTVSASVCAPFLSQLSL